jgi:glycosyltransferase involved in cell wall biosynthesis
MRLCILADGSSYHTQRWANYFAAQGDEVHLISLERILSPTKAQKWQLRSRIELKALKYLLAYPEVKRLLSQIGPDLVNAHFIPNYGFLAALCQARPLVITAWGSDLLVVANRTPFHRWRTHYALSRADLILSDAQILSRAAYEFGASKDRVITRPWGIDLKRFQPGAQARDGDQVITYRSLRPLYNYPQLLRAIPEVVSELKSTRFLIIGEGEERDRLIRLSRRLGVERYISFKPPLPLPELVTELQRSTVYVSTARSDSTSVSLLEAMACGVFPVVTDLAGNREWIEDGVNGYLVPPGDYLRLAQRITSALKDEKLRAEAARINYRLVRERADFQKNMDLLRSHFLRLS